VIAVYVIAAAIEVPFVTWSRRKMLAKECALAWSC